jgi:hypothetical protein
MRKPIFFISHSSAGLPEEDRAVQIRDALAKALEARGWDVFLDREVLAAGDRWRTHIVYGLAQADAASILFNNRALSSDWVTAEGIDSMLSQVGGSYISARAGHARG